MVWWLLAAWAADDVTWQTQQKVLVGEQASITFGLRIPGTLEAATRCGGKGHSGRSEGGEPLALHFPSLPEGVHDCTVDVDWRADDGSSAQATLPMRVWVRPMLTLEAGADGLDVAGGTLQVTTNRPVVQAQAAVHGPDGLLGTVQGTPSDQGVAFRWEASDTRVLRIDVQGEDAEGYITELQLTPWRVDIPHEDVVFPSGSAKLLAEEEPKLEASYAELVKGAPCQSGRHVLQFLPVGVPFVSDRWWVTIRSTTPGLHDVTSGSARELTWRNAPDGSSVTSDAGRAKMEEGVMVEKTTGSWLLIQVDASHTLVEYQSLADPGGNLSPASMQMFAGRSIRKTLNSMAEMARDPNVGCRGAR